MKIWTSVVGTALLAVMGVSSAQATAIDCGNSTLGVRVTTVDPGKVGGLCYADLTNLGDGALEKLLADLTSDTTAKILDRDTVNTNGGLLSITGVGGTSGTWSFSADLWDDYERLFLYFHFGDGPDGPPFPTQTDPDIFIVELMSTDATGGWEFSGQQGLSVIALMRTGLVDDDDDNPPPPAGDAPEPMSLALLGIGLAGIGFARRRAGR